MSFQQGLSGLNAASKNLETIGNNVANANTVGFKGSQAQFADVFASSLAGGGGSQIGIGTKLSQVSQQFTQGNIAPTNNPLDVAINGNGFFRFRTPDGGDGFSRNGQMRLNDDGYIVNSAGMRLIGRAMDGSEGPLQINTSSIGATPTSAIEATLNLDSRISPAVPQPPFDMNDSDTYDTTTSATVYDTLGNPHVLQMYFVRTTPAVPPPPGVASEWQVYASAEGAPLGQLGVLQFDTSGNLVSPPDLPVTMPITNPPGADPVLDMTLSFDGTSQHGAPFSIDAMRPNGSASGNLSGFTIEPDGAITGRYTNGETRQIGQVVLYHFRNPNGLQPMGDNMWMATSSSGDGVAGEPGVGQLGLLQSSAVESSNVDLTAELINMITAQRIYQANAQTIKTQDQVMQTLVNLR